MLSIFEKYTEQNCIILFLLSIILVGFLKFENNGNKGLLWGFGVVDRVSPHSLYIFTLLLVSLLLGDLRRGFGQSEQTPQNVCIN